MHGKKDAAVSRGSIRNRNRMFLETSSGIGRKVAKSNENKHFSFGKKVAVW
jgi:hypothetical protein